MELSNTRMQGPSEVYMKYGKEEAAEKIRKAISNAEQIDIEEDNIPEAVEGAPVNLRQPEGWIYSKKGISVIDEKKNYIGGMIYPGVNISLNALTENASQLQGIGLEAPKRIVGKNTIECMKSGVLYSSAAAIDGIIDRIEEAIGQPMTAIATGGLSKKIVPYCKREVILDDDLLLKGLLIIYRKAKS